MDSVVGLLSRLFGIFSNAEGVVGIVLRIVAIIAIATLVRWVVSRFKRPSTAGEGQPDIQAALAAYKKKDWEGLLAIYSDRSPSDRYHLLQGLGRLTEPDGPLPSDPTGRLAIIAAGLCVGWAWRHRGAGTSMTERGALRMVQCINRAKALLEALGDDADSVACALSIRAEMGYEGNRGVLQRWLNFAATLKEPNIFVAYCHLMFVAPKWNGSVAEMFEVAKEYAATPASAAWLTLPAMAHAEALLYGQLMTDSPAEKVAAREFYFNNPAYADELAALDDAFWRARREQGLLGHAELMFAHNWLGYALYRKEMYGRLAPHLDGLGKDLFEIPWTYVGVEPHEVNQIRKVAGVSEV